MGRGRPGRGWRRVFHIHADRVAQTIPPLDALQDEIDKRVAAGESEEDVTLAIIEDAFPDRLQGHFARKAISLVLTV